MKIACLQVNPIQENTYVVWDNTKACIVIDAGNSNPREDAALDNFIAEHGLKPVMAVNTHGHFDHTLGEEVHIYPGHGPESTIGHETLYNPFIVEVLNEEINYRN